MHLGNETGGQGAVDERAGDIARDMGKDRDRDGDSPLPRPIPLIEGVDTLVNKP